MYLIVDQHGIPMRDDRGYPVECVSLHEAAGWLAAYPEARVLDAETNSFVDVERTRVTVDEDELPFEVGDDPPSSPSLEAP